MMTEDTLLYRGMVYWNDHAAIIVDTPSHYSLYPLQAPQKKPPKVYPIDRSLCSSPSFSSDPYHPPCPCPSLDLDRKPDPDHPIFLY